MVVKSTAELKALKRIGRIVRIALDEMAAAVRPGITTAEISEIAARVLADNGAESTPPKVYGFPGVICISVNEQAIHGVPGPRVLKEGDLVKLDLTADKDGFVADAAVSVPDGKVSAEVDALVRCAERAFRQGAKAAHVGNRVYDIGRAVEKEVRASGFDVIKALAGHGVGRTIHESPSIPNYFDKRSRSDLKEGLVITIEPIIAAKSGRDRRMPDGWTISTEDGSVSAHFEHTVMITKNGPLLITQSKD
jgi:methionyl aminopeptidase